MKKLKIAFAYNAWDSSAMKYHDRIVEQGRVAGFDVYPVVATPNAPSPRLSWNELDKKVALRDRTISKYRDKLIEQIAEADVFWLFNGANFHPSWLSLLPQQQLKVYSCHDDPESSSNLSLPVSPYFDVCLVGNIAAIPMYQGYTRRPTKWLPLFADIDQPLLLDEATFFTQKRSNDLVFLGERESNWRNDRLRVLEQQFPDGKFYGHGWANGFHKDKKELYQSAKIGINIHNSTGPINLRTYELPACGAMQICDNKCRYGHIFDLNRQGVGYDTIDEAVELIKYYLDPAHTQERLEIAWNGYQRYQSDYTADSIWSRAYSYFESWYSEKQSGKLQAPSFEQGLTSRYESLLPVLRDGFDGSSRAFSAAKRLAKSFVATSSHIIQLDHQNSIPLSFRDRLRAPLEKQEEMGAINFEYREDTIKECGFFEYPNMVALNWTVASLVQDAKNILEVGSGTGAFAFEAAQDPSRTLLCLEDNEGARNWAITNRSRVNITYASKKLSSLDTTFDLMVSVDVIEHIEDYQSFLTQFKRLARRVIITTPNRMRENPPRLKPSYEQHVQEWSAGEFYYMLRQFWDSVYLLAMPDPYVPLAVPIDINSDLTPLIAICE